MKKQMMTVGSLVALIAGLSFTEGHAATTTAQPQHQTTSVQKKKAPPHKHRKRHVRPATHDQKAPAHDTVPADATPTASSSESIKAKKN